MTRAKRSAAAVFVLFFLSYSSVYIARLNFSIASAILQESNVLNTELIGIIGSVFFVTYAVSKLINGYVGDRVSPKIMICTGLLITALSNIIIGIFPVYIVIAVFWGVNAFGQAMIWGPMMRQLSFYYNGLQMKSHTAFLITSVPVGSIAGLLTASICAAKFSVSICFIVPGAITLGMFFAVLALLDRINENICADKPVKKQSKRRCFTKEFWLLTAPAFFQGMIKENITIWMALYFVDVYDVDIKNIGGFIFFLPLMGLVGRFLFPPLFKLFKANENRVSIFAFCVCVIAVVPLIIGSSEPTVSVVSLGTVSAMVSVINTHMVSTFPSHFAESGNIAFMASTMDVVLYAGAGIGSLVFGMIIGRLGYVSMFVIWGVASVISVGLLILADRTKKKTVNISSVSESA